MRVITLLALVIGTMMQMLLDGQTFTHAVVGIICGIVVVIGGLGSARKEYEGRGRRWMGRIIAGVGLVLAIFCVVQLPSAYKFQKKFNDSSRRARQMDRPQTPLK